MSDAAPLMGQRRQNRTWRGMTGAAAVGLGMVAWSACTVPPPPPAPHAGPPATAAPLASNSEPPAATVRAAPRAVAGGYALPPLEPRPQRPEMAGTAALVWEVTPAPANEDGPRERDAVRTRLVIAKDGAAAVVAERGEAVFASRTSLWRLRAEELTVEVEDCAVGASRPIQERRHHIIFESLEHKPRRIAPMAGPVLAGEWARLDLESMAGPFVQVTVDRYASNCQSLTPRGSGYRLVLDLDAGAERTLTTPPGVRPGQVARVREAMAAGCGHGREEIVEGGVGFHYDTAGDLVAEYDFFEYVAPVCYAGTLHVFAGSFVLPPELTPHARLPRWLREWLAKHPSRGVSMIPIGREAEARKEMLSLPASAPPLPRDSGGGG